jgi:hypothetical protein
MSYEWGSTSLVNPARGIGASSPTRDGTFVYVLHLTHPGDLDRVCVFLRGVHLEVRANEGGTITVGAPGAPTALHERREIGGYVTTWNALHPASPVRMAETEG